MIPERSQGVQSWDRYAYVNNNPVRYNDPSGHMTDDGCRSTGCEVDWHEKQKEAYDRQRQQHRDCIAGKTTYCSPVDNFTKQVSVFNHNFNDTVKNELNKPQYEPLLKNKYTPVVFGAISVIATDVQFIAPGILPPPISPLVVGSAYLISRGAGIVGTVSTGYQYSHNLYGTTQEDLEISAGAMIISSIPKPDLGFVNSMGFLYTFFRTFGVIESP